MYTTIDNVLVGENVVARGLYSLDEAEYIRECWLDVFPYLSVSIESFTELNCGDFIV